MAQPPRTPQPLGDAALAAVADLTRRRLAADGGLPPAADASFIARRYGPPAVAFTVPAAAGGLAGAASVRDGSPVAFVAEPEVAGPLLDAALAHARAGGGTVEVETEFVAPWAAELFAGRGLTSVFAEDVLRYDLTAPDPAAALPSGITVQEWTDDLAPRFHAVYSASFADRPGFPGWSVEQWVEWSVDDEFQPAASLLATDASGADVGFLTSAGGWMVQVGVPPEARGRGIGAGLVVSALGRHRAAGAAEVLLDVAVDNPAGELYRRLGFTQLGRRGRFRAV